MQPCKDSDNPDLCLFKRHAAFCSVFSNPLRLQMMFHIGEKERSVSELAELLNLTMPHTSQHLRVMRDQGALTTRREGHAVYYRLSNVKFLRAATLIREGLCELMQQSADAASEQVSSAS